MTGSWDYNTPHEPPVYFLPLSSALAVAHASASPHKLTHVHTSCSRSGVCVCIQGADVRVLCVEARSDECLLSQKGNKMSLCKDVGMIRQRVTCCECARVEEYLCDCL